jgi:hypothetical protein
LDLFISAVLGKARRGVLDGGAERPISYIWLETFFWKEKGKKRSKTGKGPLNVQRSKPPLTPWHSLAWGLTSSGSLLGKHESLK